MIGTLGARAVLLAGGGARRAEASAPRAGSVFAAVEGEDDPGRRFAALVTRYQSRVYRLVAGILGPGYSADAEDATQEVFLLAYRKLGTFRGDSRLSTWLYRLAYNRAIDYRRRLDRRREDPELPEERSSAAAVTGDGGGYAPRTPLGRLLADERGAGLRRQLERLKPKQRTAVHLFYWLGCTVDEIAELMDSRPSTVKSHLFRARRALARALAKEQR